MEKIRQVSITVVFLWLAGEVANKRESRRALRWTHKRLLAQNKTTPPYMLIILSLLRCQKKLDKVCLYRHRVKISHCNSLHYRIIDVNYSEIG